ncbi:siderophore ABC transporter substrate-binding protein [Labrenzia sp. 011]|uniref:siderophore ABC transporter substrate-binding protein n=1 Tax=Labrenzia sp. 011 TaxID=2171494 RepID=UPI000D5060D1|nr:siderophore ABC transporter substrate-binding protein [Labrenzia sp. 011]PVB62400.1 iron ABC transporter substrate-binding protein [Labrenzia sp. 011]
MRSIPSLAALAAAMVLGTQALAGTVSIETAKGPVEVPASPEKIAVFDIAAIDTLNALGVAIAGAPQNVYVDHLEDISRSAEPIGTLFEPDFEALNALQPDLIIAGGRSSSQVEALSALAPTIDVTIWGDGLLDQARARLAAYGQLFDKTEEAARLDAEMAAAIDSLRTQATGAGKALIVLTNGPKISVYGPGSRFGWLYTELGIDAAVETTEDSTHGEGVSFEFIRDVNPDWLLVIDRAAAIGAEGASAAETLDNKLVAETTAWKKGQVIYLDAAKIYISAGGYQSVLDTMADLAAAFSKAN